MQQGRQYYQKQHTTNTKFSIVFKKNVRTWHISNSGDVSSHCYVCLLGRLTDNWPGSGCECVLQLNMTMLLLPQHRTRGLHPVWRLVRLSFLSHREFLCFLIEHSLHSKGDGNLLGKFRRLLNKDNKQPSIAKLYL